MAVKAPKPHFKSPDSADEHFLKNRRLVFSQARQFVGLKALSFDELVSEGDLAMLRAARQWPGDGVFSTYAVTSIRRAMLRAIRQRKPLSQEPPDNHEGPWIDTVPERPARPPRRRVDLSELTNLQESIVADLYGLRGRAMNSREVATKYGVTVDQVQSIHRTALLVLKGAMSSDEP